MTAVLLIRRLFAGAFDDGRLPSLVIEAVTCCRWLARSFERTNTDIAGRLQLICGNRQLLSSEK